MTENAYKCNQSKPLIIIIQIKWLRQAILSNKVNYIKISKYKFSYIEVTT